ncbi:hypothetical protein J3R30DRAFT_3401052 [Lentinula aciculospora]|uniref:Uncharacterized protein n=1 Tax=Lentinula aciculospora TaxID=153920 RepID=A0A9W9AL05_9AGAR|nr:hypothetical protein J3R30DRAFT_3401052 [Lentinula aciculospora]
MQFRHPCIGLNASFIFILALASLVYVTAAPVQNADVSNAESSSPLAAKVFFLTNKRHTPDQGQAQDIRTIIDTEIKKDFPSTTNVTFVPENATPWFENAEAQFWIQWNDSLRTGGRLIYYIDKVAISIGKTRNAPSIDLPSGYEYRGPIAIPLQNPPPQKLKENVKPKLRLDTSRIYKGYIGC